MSNLFTPVEAKFPHVVPCKIAVVGDFPNVDSALQQKIFSGNSGVLLERLTHAAGLRLDECLQTYTINVHPINGDIKRLFMGRKEAAGKFVTFAIHKHGYLRQEYEHHLVRLFAELEKAKPNVIIAMGELSLWALTGFVGIDKFRGAIIPNTAGQKIVATYDPESVFKMWHLCPIMQMDFQKALRESDTRDIKQQRKSIYIAETKSDLEVFKTMCFAKCVEFATDIETSKGDKENPPRITTYSIAPNTTQVLVVDVALIGEEIAFNYLREWCSCKLPILHNGVYDLTWLSLYDIKPRKIEDTMLYHYSWQPELKKGLGFLASLHLDEGPWKHLRRKAKKDSNKADE